MSDLLSEYLAIASKLPIESRRRLNDFFIGALSNHVNDENWRSSLDTAMKCVDELTTVPAAGSGDQKETNHGR